MNGLLNRVSHAMTLLYTIHSFSSMSSPIILPNSVEDLEAIAQNVVTILQRGADQVVAIPEDKRSIENTLLALQEAQSEAACIQTMCTFPAMVKYLPHHILLCFAIV
jgi:hypothetical protein